MTVSSDIDRLRTEFRSALSNASTSRDLQNLHDHYLGRKRGLLAALLKTIASVPVDQRRTLGTAANSLKKEIEAALLARREGFESKQTTVEEIDVTLPGRDSPLGHRHPLTLLREEIERIFSSLGFEILHGPEVEDDYHNFEALNMPADHPARDMQTTPTRLQLHYFGLTHRGCKSDTWRPTNHQYVSSPQGSFIDGTLPT